MLTVPRVLSALVAILVADVSAGPAQAQTPPASAPASDRAIEARVAALLGRMRVERKVAQLIQPDISSITPADVRRYRFGSVLNGGNSGPGGDDKALAKAYLALADAFWVASTAAEEDGSPVVPLLWATDAVHGHNNILGATLFPHNIGLGAANDPALMRRIGEVTAAEVAVTGLDWAFAPTIAVARDVRWGRAYESYSEDPARVGRLGAALVEGLQGTPGTPGFLDQRHVLATIKHFFGDGGTGGVDRGDTVGQMNRLITVHAAPYRAGIAAGAQTVMASFSSINGERMHGNRALLTGLLRDDLHFDGLVVGDWNGHGLVPGCSNTDCPRALNAGLDIYMVPEDWRGLYASLLREVRDGTIPMARLDEAVGRVLRVKLRDGLFEKPRPSARALAGHWAELGSPAHRAVAREAVRRSLVLLKNAGVLPIRSGARVLVAGMAGDSLARQAGGWSISWQGGGTLTNADFPGATSIYAGIAQAMGAAGGHAEYSPGGTFTRRPDVAVVVFGEQPYAEFLGDRPDHALRDAEGLTLLRRFKAQHVPTVAVLLSGRPLWMNRELAVADAFVAAWLPGSEGGGVADVLVGDTQSRARQDFTGRLSFHWPADCADRSPPLLLVGSSGSYAQPPRLPRLGQTCAALNEAAQGETPLFRRGLGAGITVIVRAIGAGGGADLPGLVGRDPADLVRATAIDLSAQEDGRRVEWRRPAELVLRLARPIAPSARALVLDYAVEAGPATALTLGADCPGCRAGVALPVSGAGMHRLRVSLACLGSSPLSGLRLTARKPVTLRLVSAVIVRGKLSTGNTQCLRRIQPINSQSTKRSAMPGATATKPE